MINPAKKVRGHAGSAACATIVLFAAQWSMPAQTPNSADRVDPASNTASIPATPTTYTPLTGGERVKEFFKDTASPFSLLASAASAGLGQWKDRPKEWKQGSEAYGYRYGSSYAEHIVRETIKFGAAAAFHEDDRYYHSEDPATGTRIGHALASPFLARGSDGSRHFAFSRIGAIAGAALISRLWQPHSTNSLRSAELNFASSIGVTMGMDVVREFWPHK